MIWIHICCLEKGKAGWSRRELDSLKRTRSPINSQLLPLDPGTKSLNQLCLSPIPNGKSEIRQENSVQCSALVRCSASVRTSNRKLIGPGLANPGPYLDFSTGNALSKVLCGKCVVLTGAGQSPASEDGLRCGRDLATLESAENFRELFMRASIATSASMLPSASAPERERSD